jgi:hypothetical protein
MQEGRETMKTITRRAAATVLGAVLMTAGLAATPAAARDGDVRASGNCSNRSDWKLKLGARDNGIETEFEVDSNRVGQVWKVRIFHDGERVFAGRRTTKEPSGSFTVRITVPDHSGTDVIVGKARNLRTDERCRGRATI